MTITHERTAIDRKRLEQSIKYRLVYVAGILAIFIVFAVQTGTRYVLNDWTRERLERLLTIGLQRQVFLGQTTWSLGLTGMVVSTSKSIINDRPDLRKGPFIVADETEVGMPLIPMLVGELQLRSLKLRAPKIWAAQLGPKEWNFSDLPEVTALKNISYVDVKSGALSVLDQSHTPPASWSPRLFQKTDFHLERPFENQQWPFSLSFAVPHTTYTSAVALSGIGNGNVADWAINQHTFRLVATKVNPTDFRDIWPSMPDISGLLNMELNGEGIPAKDFTAHGVIKAPLLTFTAPGFGPFTIRDGITSGDFSVREKLMEWRNVIVQLGQFAMRSEGTITNWNTKEPHYDAKLSAVTQDMGKVASILPARLLPTQLLPPSMVPRVQADKKHLISVATAIAPARLTGSGSINARLVGLGKDIKIWADIDAKDVLIPKLAELRPFRQTPILGILGANPRANLDISMHMVPEGKSTIKSGKLDIGNSQVLINGYFFLDKKLTHLSLYSKDLNLADLISGMKSTAARRRLNALLGLPPDAEIALGGRTDINGTIDAVDESQTIRLLGSMHNVSVALNNAGFNAHSINGKFFYNDDSLQLASVTGIMGSGPFKLNGAASTSKNGPIDLHYQGKSVDLASIRSALLSMRVNSPFLKNPNIRGRLEDVDLVVKGTSSHPDISLSGRPRQIAFQPSGQPGAIVLNGGFFRIQHNQIFIQQLSGLLGRGSFSVTGNIAAGTQRLTLTGSNIDISYFRQALIDLGVHAPLITGPQVVFGTLRTATMVVNGQSAMPQFKLTASPLDVYYQPKGVPRTFLLTSGTLIADNSQVIFKGLGGTLGKGTFTLDGHWRTSKPQGGDVTLNGRNLDVSNIKLALQAAGVRSPLLEQQQLYGRVHELSFHMKGSPEKPVIDLAVRPEDVRFEPFGSKRMVHLTGGLVTYKNDRLVLDDVYLASEKTNAKINLVVDSLTAHSKLTELHLSSLQLDLADISSYTAAPRTSPGLRDRYRAILRNYDISEPMGLLSGQFNYVAGDDSDSSKQFTLSADITLKDLGLRIHAVPLENINGRIYTHNASLAFENLRGLIGNSTFTVNGEVENYQAAQRNWQAKIASNIDLQDLLGILPAELQSAFGKTVSSDRGIDLVTSIQGNQQAGTKAIFSLTAQPGSNIKVKTPLGLFTQPADQPVSLTGELMKPPDSSTIAFTNTKLSVGNSNLISGLSGSLQGPGPSTKGEITIATASSQFKLCVNALKIGKVDLHNLRGNIRLEGANESVKVFLDAVTAQMFSGTVDVDGSIELKNDQNFSLNVNIAGMDVNEALKKLTNTQGELSGRLVARATLSGSAKSKETLLNQSRASGRLVIQKGNVKRFSELEKQITLGNLLKEGILGLNLNNVMAAIAPVHNGNFHDFSSNFVLEKSVVSLSNVLFNGEELHMRAQGLIDLVERTGRFNVVGSIPRVSKAWSGPGAALLQHLSFSALLSPFTDKLDPPDIPVIGNLGNTEPRPFAFKMDGTMDDPDSFNKSIKKTFKFLPNKPKTTYPIQGITAQPEAVGE